MQWGPGGRAEEAVQDEWWCIGTICLPLLWQGHAETAVARASQLPLRNLNIYAPDIPSGATDQGGWYFGLHKVQSLQDKLTRFSSLSEAHSVLSFKGFLSFFCHSTTVRRKRRSRCPALTNTHTHRGKERGRALCRSLLFNCRVTNMMDGSGAAKWEEER